MVPKTAIQTLGGKSFVWVVAEGVERDGQYVIIQFKASFENKKSAVETITPMLDQDGTWRVSGYYMK